eukprot:2993417-Pleurochrysis_carterae.AAC.1
MIRDPRTECDKKPRRKTLGMSSRGRKERKAEGSAEEGRKARSKARGSGHRRPRDELLPRGSLGGGAIGETGHEVGGPERRVWAGGGMGAYLTNPQNESISSKEGGQMRRGAVRHGTSSEGGVAYGQEKRRRGGAEEGTRRA